MLYRFYGKAIACLAIASLGAPDLFAADCGGSSVQGERVVAERVVDGDTLVLSNGRRLRLIGIDAPELDWKTDQSLAKLGKAAKIALAALLGERRELRLVSDIQAHDRYDRLLAHAFLPDGTSLTVALLRLGLANTLIIPPNLQFSSCYLNAENEARIHGRGLWASPSYRAVEADSSAAATPGVHVVNGVVTAVRDGGKKHFFLDLGSRFSVRVDFTDASVNPQMLIHRRVGVRGKVYRRHHRSYLRVPSLASLWFP